MKHYIAALDQGTTSSRAILFDKEGNQVASHSCEFRQIFPQPGWVEHDPEEIWESQLRALNETLKQSAVDSRQIRALGITNQRETTVIWDRTSGEPVHNAIVWQSRQSESICEDIRQRGWSELFTERTGLVVDPYFSATKIKWILDHVQGARERASQGQLAFGTIDSWLIYKLTEGKIHATDYSNASRTLLFNIHDLKWDEELLGRLEIPISLMPRVLPSSGVFGHTSSRFTDVEIPIAGVAGDQQAALFGQACFRPGEIKNTYGTGCFALMNTGASPIRSKHGLLTTIAWSVDGQVDYALEGSVFIAGAAIQWLRDQLGLVETAAETEALARSVPSTEGVFLIPAFTGLGAPYWDSEVRGMLIGLTRGSGRAHLVRAALESIAYQTVDVVHCFEGDSGHRVPRLQVDGGACANDFLMQFQADLLGTPVRRPKVIETTALGAAFLAGLAVGFWESREQISRLWQEDCVFLPKMEENDRHQRQERWRSAIQLARQWRVSS